MDRFEHLEVKDLPETVKRALSKLDRFRRLEIGELSPALGDPDPVRSDRNLCGHCGQVNEIERELCWACFRVVGEKPSGPETPAAEKLEIILDGNVYRSGGSTVPEDVRVLMSRTQKEGYSAKLLSQWRNWRATRRTVFSKSRGDLAGETRNVDVFKGPRVSVIRIDGKSYKSNEPNLPLEIKELFTYIKNNDVTPALMDHLRRQGAKVKFRVSL